MDMIETTIRLKDEQDWPVVDVKDDQGRTIAHRRRTPDELADAVNAAVQIPGLNNAWTMPIKTRTDMLATGKSNRCWSAAICARQASSSFGSSVTPTCIGVRTRN